MLTPNSVVSIETVSFIISVVFVLASSVVGSVKEDVTEKEAVSGCMLISAVPETEIDGMYAGRSEALKGIVRSSAVAMIVNVLFLMFLLLNYIVNPYVRSLAERR